MVLSAERRQHDVSKIFTPHLLIIYKKTCNSERVRRAGYRADLGELYCSIRLHGFGLTVRSYFSLGIHPKVDYSDSTARTQNLHLSNWLIMNCVNLQRCQWLSRSPTPHSVDWVLTKSMKRRFSFLSPREASGKMALPFSLSQAGH